MISWQSKLSLLSASRKVKGICVGVNDSEKEQSHGHVSFFIRECLVTNQQKKNNDCILTFVDTQMISATHSSGTTWKLFHSSSPVNDLVIWRHDKLKKFYIRPNKKTIYLTNLFFLFQITLFVLSSICSFI